MCKRQRLNMNITMKESLSRVKDFSKIVKSSLATCLAFTNKHQLPPALGSSHKDSLS